MLKNIVNFRHLSQVEETYLQHLRFALWAGTVLIVLGVVSIVHAVFPFLLDRVPDRIFKYFLRKSNQRVTRVDSLLKEKGIE